MSRSDIASVTEPEDLVELGRVVGAYGVRGWVKIQPHSAGSAVLLKSREWWLRRTAAPIQDNAATPAWQVRVLKSRTQGSTIVGNVEGIVDRTQAERLRGCTVWVARSLFPAPHEDEYYWVDLIGCTIYGDQDGNTVLLGIVEDVTDNGAHAVLRVRRQTINDEGCTVTLLDDKGRPAESLVPFVAAHVHTVDIPNKRLESNWPADF